MSEFNYKQRPATKEYFDHYDEIDWGKKKKKVTLKEARKKALEIGKKAEEERNNWPDGPILPEGKALEVAEKFYENNSEVFVNCYNKII